MPGLPGVGNSLHWGLEDPAEVDGSDEERLAAFRRTRQELTLRLRPFIEIARRTAGLPRRRVARRVKAHLAEGVGTFALVFLGCGAIAVDAQTGQLGHVGVARRSAS